MAVVKEADVLAVGKDVVVVEKVVGVLVVEKDVLVVK